MTYWSRLRKDAPSNWAAGLATVAVIAALLSVIDLSVPGSQTESRRNPLYWGLMLPVVWWASELSGFEPRPVKTLAAVTYAAPAVAVLCLGLSYAQDRAWTLPLISAIVAGAAAIGSRMCYRRSLLYREGPSR